MRWQRAASMWMLVLFWGVVSGTRVDAQRDVIVAVPPEVRAAEGFAPAESAGLFVGIRRFDDAKFHEVPFAVDDAVDLAHLFALELELMRPGKVVLSLAGEPQKVVSRQRLAALLAGGAVRRTANKSDLLRLLVEQRQASGPRGLFVVMFATHGWSEDGSDFLLAADSVGSFLKDTSVMLNLAFAAVAEAQAPRRLMLLDACRETFRRAERALEGAAMSASFADAIARAQGLAVISGTTLGGYSYDDFELQNGVFTAAVLAALRGSARPDARGFITVQAVAEEASARVLGWVQGHRPEDKALSRGISLRLEGEVARMPLAVNSTVLRSLTSYRERRDAALARLKGQLDPPLSGVLYDEMKALLAAGAPSPERLALLAEIEALDGSERLRRALAFYWSQHRPVRAPAQEAARSEPTPRTVNPPPPPPWKDPILGIEFVAIAPGTFWMGSPAGEAGRAEDERRHQVTLTRGFQIATTEVTQGQFAEFVKDKGYQTETERDGWSWFWNGKKWEFKTGASWRDSGGPTHPVVYVTWNDAQAFCAWLSQRTGHKIRLPSEAEWEFAARAETETATYAGDLTLRGDCEAPQLGEIAWYCGNSEQKAHPVGMKKKNLWGLYDILGNVEEWTEDAADWSTEKAVVVTETYQDSVDPVSARGSRRVIRGGSWYYGARNCRAANRSADSPGYRGNNLGFRLVRTLP